MGTNKLPKNHNAFNTWFTNFQKSFNTNAKTWGFSAHDIKTVNLFFKNWQANYNMWNSWNQFNKAWGQYQNSEFAFFQSFLQGFMTQISKNSKFNGDWQFWFGSTATNTKVKPVKKSVKKTTSKSKSTSKPSITAKPIAKSTKKTTRTSPRAKSTTSIAKPVVKTVATVTKKATAKKVIAKKAVAKKPTTKKVIAKKAVMPKAVKKTTPAIKPVAKKAVAKPATKVAKPIAKTAKPIAKVNKPVSKTVKAKPVAKKTTVIKPSTTHAPFVWFTSGKNGVNVYVGSNKNSNFSLPTGTKGAYVEFKNGGRTWKKLTQGSNFPFIHHYSGSGKVSYRACWINSNGRKGSWSKPVSMSNAPKAAA